MGTAGLVLGATALGVGAAALGKKKNMSYASEVHSTMTPNKPETPEAPSTPTETTTGASTDNSLMEAERERERQRAALRQQQAQEIFTSGLGASGLAETSKKTLLGG